MLYYNSYITYYGQNDKLLSIIYYHKQTICHITIIISHIMIRMITYFLLYITINKPYAILQLVYHIL
jgi:hypothetical protein